MGAGLLGGNVLTAYESLLTAFYDLAVDANRGSVEWSELNGSLRPDERDPRNTILDVYIHLDQWAFRDDKISALIRVQERIQKKPLLLIQSTVNVSYYSVDEANRSARLLHNMHFDFEGPRDNHPIFHAQLCADAVELPMDAREQLSFKYSIEPPSNKAVCFKGARVPTADMTLPSVLLCMSADAVEGRELFMGFVEKVCELETRLPRPDCDRALNSIGGSTPSLRSHHWFSHMQRRPAGAHE